MILIFLRENNNYSLINNTKEKYMSDLLNELLGSISENEVEKCKETCEGVLSIYANTQERRVYLRMIAHDIQGEQF